MALSDRQAAQARMDEAKRAYTRAVHASLRGLPLARVQAIAALEDLNAARAALAKASVKELHQPSRHPGALEPTHQEASP